MRNQLLVIIVTYNGMKWLERCLSSLRLSTVPSDVYIVDNGSTDGSQEYIRSNFKDAIFVQSEENLRFGKANNIGLQYAYEKGYEYVYLLNQDAWVEETTFETLISMHKKYPEYGVLSPIQIQADKTRMDRKFLNNVAYRTLGSSLIEDLYFGKTKEIYEVKDVMAAHWLISRDCLLKTGCFSPTFRHYGEDDNYLDRAIFHGFKVGIIPATKAVHDRADRKDTIASLSYRCNTMGLVELSKITSKINWKKIIFKYAQYTYNYGMFRHYKYMLIHLFKLRKILKTREESKKQGAFLNL